MFLEVYRSGWGVKVWVGNLGEIEIDAEFASDHGEELWGLDGLVGVGGEVCERR